MTNTCRSLASLLLFAGTCAAGECADWTPIENSEEYRLVWSDEFENDGPPNPENWVFEKGFVRNEELQWYQPENAICRNGCLYITARKEFVSNTNHKPGSASWRKNRKRARYTSACVKTKGLHDWQYGRFEIKAKFPTKAGFWPAIWFLGVEGKWPSCGEIDLMEYYDHSILANACWSSNHPRKPTWDAMKIP